ncbi:MAG: hypothetical protein RIS29_1564, partial [Bacteroidota bacterium]
RQSVTGVIVNEKVQVSKEKRKKIRQEVYFIEKFGLSSHLVNINCTKKNYLKHLLGEINFILQINPLDKEAILQKNFLICLLKNKPIISVYKKNEKKN